MFTVVFPVLGHIMHVVGCLVTCPVWFGLISVRSKRAHPAVALWLHLYICVCMRHCTQERSTGLGFDPHCWSGVEVSGKPLCIHCLYLLSGDGYLMEWKR